MVFSWPNFASGRIQQLSVRGFFSKTDLFSSKFTFFKTFPIAKSQIHFNLLKNMGNLKSSSKSNNSSSLKNHDLKTVKLVTV